MAHDGHARCEKPGLTAKASFLNSAHSMADSNRQEANSALLVIDKGKPLMRRVTMLHIVGLKSHQLGEQCEAIVRFPALMDKFPFPVMIDVAYLRLADTFRTESVIKLLSSK